MRLGPDNINRESGNEIPGAWMPSDSGPLREQMSENGPVAAVENHPIAAERGVGRHDIEENFCSRSLSRQLLKLESKQANMMQESLKVYRLLIFLALAVSFVSGKINVTNNIIVLHRLRYRVSILRLRHSK